MIESVSLAFQGVWSHKLRSFLTMLGIIIGIASIITIVSTIKGTNEQIKENLVGAGSNAVVVQLNKDNYPYDMDYSSPPDGVVPVTEETRLELAEIDRVEDVSLFLRRRYANNVYYGNNTFNGQLYGATSTTSMSMAIISATAGTFLEEDFRLAKKVCILDTKACFSPVCRGLSRGQHHRDYGGELYGHRRGGEIHQGGLGD